MPRPLSGTIEARANGRLVARITHPGGDREYYDLPPGIDREQAKALAQQLAIEAQAGRLKRSVVQHTRGETVAEFAARWLDERERRGLKSVRDDRGRMRGWVLPEIGALDVGKVTAKELRALVAMLDDAVLAEECSWKTASNTWGLASKMFSDATTSKREEFRVLGANPAAEVQGPDRGAEKAKTFLYPSELRAVLVCGAVPLHWRRLFALAVYTYARAGELEALAWSDVDLEAGVLHIHAAADRETGDVRETKTGITRRVPIEPALLPLLRALRAESEGAGRVLPWMPSRELGASTLRESLQKAGVTREELFVNSKTHKHVTFHDLRATGITWLAVRGDEPLRIQRRAGHADLKTTQKYIRTAEDSGGAQAFGALFDELPAAVVMAAPAPHPASDAGGGESSGNRRGEKQEARNPNDSEPLSSVPNGIRTRSEVREQHPSAAITRVYDVLAPPHATAESTSVPSIVGAPTNPRTALVVALSSAIRDGSLSGDLALARVAMRALEDLLGSEVASVPALRGAK